MAAHTEHLRPGIICRLATIEDYFGVVEISGDQYGGRDILKHMFFKYLDNPKRLMTVAEHNGTVVSCTTAL